MSVSPPPFIDRVMLEGFRDHLKKSVRVVALLGAGLSASSGLPTFRGAGGLWRTHDATKLATPEAFSKDPTFVWQFYSYRRHMALNAKPNRAHIALAELARKNAQFITLSQNVDGLSPRAGHPSSQLKLLHGSLYDVKCCDQRGCGFVQKNNFTDPIVPALAIPIPKENATSEGRTNDGKDVKARPVKHHALVKGADIADDSIPLPKVDPADLPRCSKCNKSLMRPGVVWFGEQLPEDVMRDVDAYFSAPEPIDLMLVIGTSSRVWPAAGYARSARSRGARVAVINMDPADAMEMTDKDWFFHGDAAVILPELLKPIVGEV